MNNFLTVDRYTICISYDGQFYVFHSGENGNKAILCNATLGDALIFVGNKLNNKYPPPRAVAESEGLRWI